MSLYLLRHADALVNFNDAERPLSPKGWKQVTQLCGYLNKDLFENVVAIYHSPLLRALETAEGFKNGLELKMPLKIVESLVPGGNIVHAGAFFAKQESDVIAVGHNPHFEALVSYLISEDPNGCHVTMKKCSLACLSKLAEPSKETPAGVWSLEWLVSPKIME